MNVFQEHCLQRYAERVLKKDISPRQVMFKYIFKHEDSAYHIVLPTPSHPASIYSGFADALFLGDYEMPTEETKNISQNWYNTCISLRETHFTQEKILQTLESLQKTVKIIGYNPIEHKDYYERNKNKILNNDNVKNNFIQFLKNSYMLYQLHLSFKFSFTDIFLDEINTNMNFIKDILIKENIDVDILNPIDKDNGIAIRGEINYKNY